MTRVTCVPLCEQAAAIVRRELQLSPLKETFYFGGSRQRRFRRDLRTLAGPDMARGALPGEPPLWVRGKRSPRLLRGGFAEPSRHLLAGVGAAFSAAAPCGACGPQACGGSSHPSFARNRHAQPPGPSCSCHAVVLRRTSIETHPPIAITPRRLQSHRALSIVSRLDARHAGAAAAGRRRPARRGARRGASRAARATGCCCIGI